MENLLKKQSKKIDTLVEDIYDLFKKKVQVDRRILNKYTKVFGDTLQEAIERSTSEESVSLRMSLLGLPDRKLYYLLRNHEGNSQGNTLEPWTHIKFLYGHTVEAMILALAEIAGHEVTRCQEEVKLNGIKGHIDAFIDGILVDIKSASSYGFKKFLGNNLFDDDPFGYLMQISGYAQAVRAKEAVFIVVNKESGEIALFHINEIELENASKRIDHIRDFTKKDKPPKRCYSDEPFGKKGNRVLKKECSEWCPFREQCWGDKLRRFQYSTGVKYFTKVVDKPRVPEIR